MSKELGQNASCQSRRWPFKNLVWLLSKRHFADSPWKRKDQTLIDFYNRCLRTSDFYNRCLRASAAFFFTTWDISSERAIFGRRRTQTSRFFRRRSSTSPTTASCHSRMSFWRRRVTVHQLTRRSCLMTMVFWDVVQAEAMFSQSTQELILQVMIAHNGNQMMTEQDMLQF